MVAGHKGMNPYVDCYGRPIKSDDESYQDYSLRQNAYIMQLEHELEGYRCSYRTILEASDALRCWSNSIRDAEERRKRDQEEE